MSSAADKLRRWPFVVLGVVAASAVIYLFLPFLQTEINLQLRAQPPGEDAWLGTDALGRDLLAALAQSASRSMVISIGSGIVASLLGVLIGSISAFYGDDLLGISWRGITFGLLLAMATLYLLFVVWPIALLQGAWYVAILITASLFGGFWLLYRLAARFVVPRKRWAFPLDKL